MSLGTLAVIVLWCHIHCCVIIIIQSFFLWLKEHSSEWSEAEQSVTYSSGLHRMRIFATSANDIS